MHGLGPRALAVALVTLFPLLAVAQPPSASASASASGVAAPASAPIPTDPRVAQIRALLRADLEVAVDPTTLFDVPLDDATAVDVERVRLRALLRMVDEANAPPPEPAAKAKTPKPAASATPSATPAGSTRTEIAELQSADWNSRLELDRVRLDFYELPDAERADLLAAHTQRREEARPKETPEQARARETEAQRKKALQAAAEARSEAARLVAEETARLIGVGSATEAIRADIDAERKELTARRDEVLGWQRRVRGAKAAGSGEADATYKAIRATLRASRDALSAALDEADDASSAVPELGPDPTADLGVEVPTDEVHARRAEVEKLARAVRAEEIEIRAQRAAALQEEIATLNRERLGLLPFLTPSVRSATTGFTDAGLDQARSEVRHLGLILRYHREIVSSWLGSLRSSKGAPGVSTWSVAVVLVPCLLLVMAFTWLRRRTAGLLLAAQQRFAEQDRNERRTVPSLPSRALVVARGLHKPLEWLIFFLLFVSLLPAKARGLLEVQIFVTVVGWTLGGALVVNGIHAVAATEDVATSSATDVSRLRLRSLQLVGRVVVVFALILVVSARLVGEGTLYSWVISTCWFAALPVFLVLVRWWREIVFERVERVRRKSGFEAWALANRRGWTSFLAAMAAAVHLFTLGTYKVVRKWVTGFDIARRAHAYLFKRGLDRMGEAEARPGAVPLRAAARDALAPDRAAPTWIACPADEIFEKLEARLKKGGHGIIAIVGPIGMGKTTLLRHIDSTSAHARRATCTATTSPDDLAKLLEPAQDGDAAAPRLVLLDEAHAMVRPVAGGLRAFDANLAFAREHDQSVLWVFAIDSILWPFLRRARDARPLFDEVLHLESWSDENIGELITSRCAAGGFAPTFEDLLEKLPPGADEIDKQEALVEKRTGYFRMIWDYARGNPAIALEAWRASLVEEIAVPEPSPSTDPASEAEDVAVDAPRGVSEPVVRVRPLQVPPSTRLEALPDPALFVLRAVLQLSGATVPELATATRMSESQVRNAVSFGISQGYYARDGEIVHVTWPWLRSVMVWLERRHLLVNA